MLKVSFNDKDLQDIKEDFVPEYSERPEHTSIFSRDALDVIKKTDSEDTFQYVDPPISMPTWGVTAAIRRTTSTTYLSKREIHAKQRPFNNSFRIH